MTKASNRAQIIGRVHDVLKKHYQPVSPTTRSVLENLLFACCLEDGKYEQADECFSRLRESYFDWNEIRVTTVRELGETLKGIPNATANALNLKNTLQSVFESQYNFDLEHLKKLNLGKAIELLESYKGTTQFSVAYVAQMNLGGHSIPLGKAGVDIFYIVGAVNEKEAAAGTVPGLERAIPKAKGIEFGSLLHQFAADLIASPFSTNIRNILLEMAPDCKERLPKRVDKKKLEAERKKQEEEALKQRKAEEAAEKKAAEAAKKAAAKKIAEEKSQEKKEQAKSAAAKKASKAEPKKKKAAKPTPKKTPAASEAKKKAATKKTTGTKTSSSKAADKSTTKKATKKAATKKTTKKKAASKKSTPSKASTKKTAAKKATKPAKKKMVKKAQKASKKSTTKSLARKKPR